MKKHPLAVAVLAGVVTATAPIDALAQELALEEVVVTARKRTENLQDVGFSVSALTQSEIEGQFARDITDLVNIAPNIVIDDTAQGPGGVAAIFIRGVGVADVEKNFDPAVGVVVDGMFIGANAGSLLRSIDLASMEVLRGPQGTLFGRNTFGGVINIISKNPGDQLEGSVHVAFGDEDYLETRATVNIPLGERTSGRISAFKRERDGYVDAVQYRDLQLGSDDIWGARIRIRSDLTNTFSADFSADYSKAEETPGVLRRSVA